MVSRLLKIFFVLLFLVHSQVVFANEAECTKSIFARFKDYLSSIFIKPAPIPDPEKLAIINKAKAEIVAKLGIKEEQLDEGFIGGMYVTITTKGNGKFPDIPSIPPGLRNEPIKGKVIKVLKGATSEDRILRDEIAYEELSSVIDSKKNVKLCKKNTIKLPDGTNMIIQDKAPGKHVREVFKDLLGDVFTKAPDEYELESLISAFSNKDSDVCLGLKPLPTNVHINIPCGNLIDAGVDLPKLQAKMKSTKIKNLRDTLHELHEVSEGKHLTRTSERNVRISLGNKLFFNDRMSPVWGLDMSVENFNIDVSGDKVTAHIFDW